MTLTARQQAEQRHAGFMDPARLARLEKVKSMRARHIGSLRDAQVRGLYQKLIDNTQIGTAKLAGIMIMGESGSGKTHLVRQMEKLPDFQPYYLPDEPRFQMLPYVSIDAPSQAAPNVLIAEIIKKCGFPVYQPGNTAAMISMAMSWFEKRRVMFVHIDEFQHALRNTEKQIQAIRDAIKLLVQLSADWPVQVILTGTSKLEEFRKGNRELATRIFPLELASMDFEKEKAKVKKIANGIVTEHAGLIATGLDTDDFAHQLLKSANYQFGNMVEVVRLACEETILAGGIGVGVDQFAHAYAMLVDVADPEDNMFLSTNWKKLEIPDSIKDGTAFDAKRRIKTIKSRK